MRTAATKSTPLNPIRLFICSLYRYQESLSCVCEASAGRKRRGVLFLLLTLIGVSFLLSISDARADSTTNQPTSIDTLSKKVSILQKQLDHVTEAVGGEKVMQRVIQRYESEWKMSPLQLKSLSNSANDQPAKQPIDLLGLIYALDDEMVKTNNALGVVSGNALEYKTTPQAYDASRGDQATGRIVNLKEGVNKTDAVNKGQLDELSSVANTAKTLSERTTSQLEGLAPEETVVSRIGQDVKKATNAMGDFTTQALGGGSTVDENGKATAPAYSISQIAENGEIRASAQPIHNVGEAVTGLDRSVTTVNRIVQTKGVELKALGRNLQSLQDDSLLWNEANNGFSAHHGDQATSRIVNLEAGANKTDAVNKGQLDGVARTADTALMTASQARDASYIHTHQLSGITADETVVARITQARRASIQALADTIGGGATVNADGSLTIPTYRLNTIGPDGQATSTGRAVSTVGAAIETLDDNITAVSRNVNEVSANVGTMRDQLDTGELGLIRQRAATRKIAVANDKDGLQIDLSGTDGARTLTGLKDGVVNDTSNEAVTGAQLNSVSQRVEQLDQQRMGMVADTKSDGSDRATVGAGSRSVAVGSNAIARGANSVATGAGSYAQGAEGVAIGANAKAVADKSVAIGAASEAARASTVSVGSKGAERQVTNVAAATQETDAVNLSQARRISQESGRRVMRDANAYTDKQVGQLRGQAYAGIASAMAMAALPLTPSQGRSMVAMSTSVYEGQSAAAVGLSGRSEGGSWTYKVLGSGTAQGDIGLAAGVGYEW